jgi:hypothetical protein
LEIVIEKYQSGDCESWNAFVKKVAKSHFFFQRNFMDYHEDRFSDHSLVIKEDDVIIAVLPANKKGDTLYSHQGLTFGSLLHDDIGAKKVLDCFDAIVSFSKKLGLKSIEYKAMPSILNSGILQEDLYALQRSGFKIFRRDISTAVKLGVGEVILIRSLRKDKRRNYNKGQRLKLKIRRSEEYSNYWNILEHVLSKYHDASPTHSKEEIELLANRFPANIQHFEMWNDNGEILGGAVLFITEDVVHTQYMSVNETGRKIGALDFLLVSLMMKYDQSHAFFSFGISTENGGEKLNEGLIFQKEGFGGFGSVHDFYKLELDA